MKKKCDDYQSVLNGMRLLEDLLIPEVTPRVPGNIRNRARTVIQDFPNEKRLEEIFNNHRQQEKLNER
jgi:hypothetical protein